MLIFWSSYLQEVILDLYERKIQSVIIEGGAQTLQAFIDLELWDEARVFVSSTTFKKGIPVPVFQGQLIAQEKIASDEFSFYKK
jgi:diaminohydroxyphosphoribosylaminopyrimidine deaminase/5-amino-6-(5-phosphoribosylamino)uracil reductase